MGLGKVYVTTKEFAKAETVLKEVIGIDQKNMLAREDLFKLYLQVGSFDEAKETLKEISQLDLNKDVKELNTSLDAAKAVGTSKESYDQGIKQMNNKEYLSAVDSFQKVISEDSERHTEAQLKILDCRKA